MRLVDTSAWIEWLKASPTGKRVERLLPEPIDWLVPTVIQLELAKWSSREINQDKADQVMAFTSTCVVAPLDTTIALAAAEYCALHKLATADAILYATAVQYGADIVTCDAHFEGLPAVRFLAKSAS